MKGWFEVCCNRLITALLIGVFAPPLSAATTAEQIPLSAYEHAQTLVRLTDGRRVNLLCIGQGSPAVVLEAGGGDDSLTYRILQAHVAHFTRVCSYDRAGMGFSDPSSHPSSAEYVLQDLHELLRQADIPLPIVLVGHSDGGLYISMYASRWPDDVAGMVLIDPFQVGAEEHAERVLTPTQLKAWLADDQKDIAQARKCLALAQSGELSHQPQKHRDCLDEPANPDPALHRVLDEQMARPGEAAANLSQLLDTYPPAEGGMSPAEKLAIQTPLKMGNKPLIILDATHEQFDYGQDLQDRLLLAMWQAQDAAIASSTRGRRIIVDGSIHYIHQERPELVAQAIHDVIDAARCSPHVDCAATH